MFYKSVRPRRRSTVLFLFSFIFFLFYSQATFSRFTSTITQTPITRRNILSAVFFFTFGCGLRDRRYVMTSSSKEFFYIVLFLLVTSGNSGSCPDPFRGVIGLPPQKWFQVEWLLITGVATGDANESFTCCQ